MIFYPTGENPYELHAHQIRIRAKVLQKYLNDEQKELQGLYALQALMVQLDQPPCKFFGISFYFLLHTMKMNIARGSFGTQCKHFLSPRPHPSFRPAAHVL